MENDEIPKQKTSPWAYLVLILVILFVGKCTLDREAGARKMAELKVAEQKEWNNSPEYRFRFCLTTAAGESGTASAEQIEACNKAAGR